MTPSNPATEAEQAYKDQQDDDDPGTVPSGDTVEADRRDAKAAHDADRAPTPDEEAEAPTKVDPKVAEAYEEANELGADVKGEGQI